MSMELQISSFPLSFNVLVYAHESVGVFTRTPFLPLSHPGAIELFQLMDGATVDAWLFFPGTKVGHN